MNNNINISDYQKIIFVNGIEESNVQEQIDIAGLSNEYPFAVFFTKKSDVLDYNNKPIHNIWFDGTRLTRFIGIDKDHDTLSIDGKKIKLNFNYDTGLLGLSYENILKSIKLIKYSYVDVNGVTITQLNEDENNRVRIFAKDNKFNLTFKYTCNDDSDISAIPKELSYTIYGDNYNYFSKYNSYVDNVNTNNDHTLDQNHTIAYEINKILPVNTNVTFTSQYSKEISTLLNMQLYQNPTAYLIFINGVGTSYQTKLQKDSQYTIKLLFDPINISSSENLDLVAEITVTDDTYNVVNIVNGYTNKTIDVQITNGVALCTLETVNGDEFPINVDVTANLLINIKYKRNFDEYVDDNYIIYDYLSRNISLLFDNEKSDKYFYFGYQTEHDMDVTSENFSTYAARLMKNYPYIEIGEYEFAIENQNDYEDEWFNEKYLYCIIPTKYAYDEETHKGITPRWKASYNNQYLPCLNWFDTVYNEITLNNIPCRIYKKKIAGKFYGLIK